MPKGFPQPRRSNRERNCVYKSLQENNLGAFSDMVDPLVTAANERRNSKKYNYDGSLFDARYPRRHQHPRALQIRQEYDDEHPDSFSPTPQTEGSENDENFDDRVSLRPRRRSLRNNHEEDEEEDEEEINGIASRSRGSRRDEKKTAGDSSGDEEAEEAAENGDGHDLSIYERVKRRRQSQQLGEHPISPKRMRTERKDPEEMYETQDEEENGGRYFLRQNRPQISRLQDEFAAAASAKHRRHGRRSVHFRRSIRQSSRRNSLPEFRRRRRDSSSSSSTSSTSDSDVASAAKDLKAEARFERRKMRSLAKGRARFAPMNMPRGEWEEKRAFNELTSRHTAHSINNAGDIEPMAVDKNVRFSAIGGLDSHIQSLKEVVAFPLVYPELFAKFDVTPPKGVLFYGSPGTGKTLMARALANECAGHKVAFFMRKGADCLSKWVGESERQLRLLFDQAYQSRPSIIFFDEIDGLCPARSSRQDQIHSSIVSTLLALMDGLDNRGQVVVIGATNRLDTIDPALRRPGRFDRELRFDLPDKTARESILQIHTNQWKDAQPSSAFLSSLAARTSGYCGADLKALCTEAVLVSIRTAFPHCYVSDEKLELDIDGLKVEKWHFEEALRRIVPASRRDFTTSSFALDSRTSALVMPLVSNWIEKMIPAGFRSRSPVDAGTSDLQKVVEALKVPKSVPSARLLLCGDGDVGETRYFLTALIGQLDHLAVFTLGFGQLFAHSTPEENLSSLMLSVTRSTSRGSPTLLVLPDLDAIERCVTPSLWHMLTSSLNSFGAFSPLLILASVQSLYAATSDSIKELFPDKRAVEIDRPPKILRRSFFEQIMDEALAAPTIVDVDSLPVPPKAKTQTQTRKLNEGQLRELEHSYEQQLRQFRIFLRDLLAKLIRDRRFTRFHLPVSVEDAPDYYEVISDPISLPEMMTKIDRKEYESKEAFLADIELIMNNALEYNPNVEIESKIIRHNAVGLFDVAAALFDEFDEEFEAKLKKTADLIAEAKAALEEKPKEEVAELPNGRRRKDSRQERAEAEGKPHGSPRKSNETIYIDTGKLEDVFERCINRTNNWTIQELEELGVLLLEEIQEASASTDRTRLPARLAQVLQQAESAH